MDTYLSVVDASARLGISDSELRNAVLNGDLKACVFALMWPATVLPWTAPAPDPERLVTVTITGRWRITSHDDLCSLTHAGRVARPHLKPVDEQTGIEWHQARPEIYAWPDFWISTGRGVEIEWSDVVFSRSELEALVPGSVAIKPPRTPKDSKKSGTRDRLAEILEALERYAGDIGQEFDRKAMPGPLGDDWRDNGSLHWLCAQIDPAFKRAKKTFEKHRADICAVASWARPSDFYRKALPAIAPKLGAPINADHRPGKER